MNDPTPSQLAIDRVWRRLDRPLWVVTAASPPSDDRPSPTRGGLIATWVTQSSLSPRTPQVVIGIAPNHYTRSLIDAGAAFGLHLLRPDQLDLVPRFADGSGRSRDKLATLEIRTAETGAPLLADCRAWLDCRPFAQLDAGDRIFYWADIVAGDDDGVAAPVLRESDLGLLPPATLDALRLDRERDIQLHEPLARGWRDSLPADLKFPPAT